MIDIVLTLNVITKNLAVTLGTALSETLQCSDGNVVNDDESIS